MSLFCVLGGLSPAKMQQIWKALTNGITEDVTTSKGNQDSCANDTMSTKVTERQTGDQQSSSRRAEWYDLSCWCCKQIVITETILLFFCKHQRHVICRHFLPLKMLVGSCLLLQRDFTFNSPWDNIFCFVCLLCVPSLEVVQQRKSLHNYMSQIKSK